MKEIFEIFIGAIAVGFVVLIINILRNRSKEDKMANNILRDMDKTIARSGRFKNVTLGDILMTLTVWRSLRVGPDLGLRKELENLLLLKTGSGFAFSDDEYESLLIVFQSSLNFWFDEENEIARQKILKAHIDGHTGIKESEKEQIFFVSQESLYYLLDRADETGFDFLKLLRCAFPLEKCKQEDTLEVRENYAILFT